MVLPVPVVPVVYSTVLYSPMVPITITEEICCMFLELAIKIYDVCRFCFCDRIRSLKNILLRKSVLQLYSIEKARSNVLDSKISQILKWGFYSTGYRTVLLLLFFSFLFFTFGTFFLLLLTSTIPFCSRSKL